MSEKDELYQTQPEEPTKPQPTLKATQTQAFATMVSASPPDFTGQGRTYQQAPFSYDAGSAENAVLSGGTLRHTVTDFALPGRNGFDLTVSRVYDSEQAGLCYYRTYWYTADNWTVCTYLYPNTHYPQLHGLGYGWYFNFPSIEALQDWVPDWAGNNYAQERYYLHLEDGRNIQIERKESTNLTIGKFKDYPLQDVVLTREEGTITHPYDAGKQYRYDVVVTYKNGNKDYFYHQRRCPSTDCWTHAIPLVARQDRFGNTIGFTHYGYGGMEIVDSWGRRIVLAKNGNTMAWSLPDGSAVQYVTEGSCDIYQNDRVRNGVNTTDVLKLARVTDQAGRVTSYSYHNINDYVMSGQFTGSAGVASFQALLLQTITHPTGAATHYDYGAGSPGAALELKLNDSGGYRRFFPFLRRRDTARGVDYTAIGYQYTRSEDGKYIRQAQVTRPSGVTEKHTFNDKGQLTGRETHHGGALVNAGSYTYGSDANAADYRLLLTEDTRRYHPGNTGAWLQKNTVWQYSADKLANPVKITETHAQDGGLNQETCLAYGRYSMETERSVKKDDGTLLIQRNLLRTAPDDKVVEYRLVLEKTGGGETLREKTRYLYGTGQDAYCVTQEQRFYVQTGALENAATCHSKFFTYDSGKYTHSPVSVRTAGLVDAAGAPLPDVVERFDYDAMGRRIAVTDGLGNTTETAYDALGRPLRELYPAVDGVRHAITFQYDDAGNAVEQTDENGYASRTVYTPLGRVERQEAGGTLLKTCTYDAAQRLIEEKAYDGAGGVRATTSTTYDSFDRVTGKTVALGEYREDHREEHTYTDVFEGRYTRHQVVVTGDADSPDLLTVSLEDAVGRLCREEVGGAVTAHYSYNRLGHKTSQTDAAGNVTRFAVDWAGRAIATTRRVAGADQTSTAAYDALGNRVSTTDWMGNRTTCVYDALGRLLKKTAPFDTRSAVTTYAYDAAGNLTEQRQQCQAPGAAEAWRETRYVYDARGRQREVYQYLDAARQSWACTRTTYDGKGNRLQMQTGLSQASSDAAAIRYTYGRFGNVLSITDALGQAETCTYDATGRLLTKTDRNGSTTLYQHDVMGRLLGEEVTAADERGSITSKRAFAYTRSGKKKLETATETKDGATTTLSSSFQYNGKGQLVTQRDPDNVEKRYTYDARGNRESFILLRGGAQQVCLFYQYDEAGRLTHVYRQAMGGPLLARYTYDANGHRTHLAYPETGMETLYTHNSAGLVTRLENRKDGDVATWFSYTYCVDGNQATKTDGTATTAYAYDRLGRLTEESDSKWSRIQYQYDRFHNRAKMTVTPTGQQLDKPYETTYTYDKNNRLLAETKTTADGTETKTYRYDKCGNQLYCEWEGTEKLAKAAKRGEISFIRENKEDGTAVLDLRQYNGFGQLIRVLRDALDIRYTYRPDRLRHKKVVRNPFKNTTTTAVYHWDGQNMVMEASGEGGSVKARYLRGANLIAQQIDGQTHYYTHNAHGDVVQRTAQNGAAAPKYEYDAFGNQRSPVATDPNPFRYCGEYYDVETKELYLRARQYDIASGRFTTEDPANYVARYQNDKAVVDPFSLNRYLYTAGNPLFFADPSGHLVVEIIMAAIDSGVDATSSAIDAYREGDNALSAFVGSFATSFPTNITEEVLGEMGAEEAGVVLAFMFGQVGTMFDSAAQDTINNREESSILENMAVSAAIFVVGKLLAKLGAKTCGLGVTSKLRLPDITKMDQLQRNAQSLGEVDPLSYWGTVVQYQPGLRAFGGGYGSFVPYNPVSVQTSSWLNIGSRPPSQGEMQQAAATARVGAGSWSYIATRPPSKAELAVAAGKSTSKKNHKRL